jgi:hypothetical protein
MRSIDTCPPANPLPRYRHEISKEFGVSIRYRLSEVADSHSENPLYIRVVAA